MLDWDTASSMGDLHSFFGLASYMHNFAVNAAPPHPLTQVRFLARLALAVTAAIVALPAGGADTRRSLNAFDVNTYQFQLRSTFARSRF